MKKNINRARQFKSILVGASLMIANIAQGQNLFDQQISSGVLLRNGMGYQKTPRPTKNLTQSSWDRFNETSLCIKEMDLSLPTGGNPAYENLSSIFIDLNYGMLCPMPAYFPTMFDSNQTTMDEFCGCIAEYLNPENTDLKDRRLMAYRGIDEKSARNLCQQLSNRTIGNALGKTVDDYIVSSVVGTLVGAIDGSTSSCRSDQIKEFFTRNLGPAVGSLNGARECSSQATAYMLDQLERNEVSCDDDKGSFFGGCSIENSAKRELAPGKVDQSRREQLQTLLESTKKLAPPEGEEPSEEHVKARAEYEKFIRKSPMGDIYATSIDNSLKKAVAKAFELSEDVDVSPKKLAALVKGTPNGKSKALRAIFTYVIGLDSSHALAKKVQQMANDINGMPSLEDIADGYVVLSDEQVNVLLKRFAPDVRRTCSLASDNFGKQCKLIASGAPFKNGEKVDNFCDDPELDISGMLSSTFDFRTWEKMIEEDKFFITKASTQQAMCYHHYRYGGLNGASNRSCERDPITGVKKGLNPLYATPEALAHNFFDRVAGPNEETSGVDVKKSIASYDSCTPFVPRALGDEFNPYLEPYKDAQKDGHRGSVISDHYAAGGSSDTLDNDYVTSNASKTESGLRDLFTADDGNGSGSDVFKEIEANAKRKVASNSREEVVSEAENFYQSQNINDLVQQQPYTVNRVATNDVVDESSIGENVPTTPEAITNSLQNNEELLRRLEELEQRNAELFKQLQERGVKEIEDADGKTVDINDAFNKTNERIQRRREEAIKERERLKEALAKANNNFVPTQNENGNFANNNIVQARPGYTPTPGGQNNNTGFVRDNVIAPSSSGGVNSGGSAGSSSTTAPVYGPIIGSQGLVLTKEALDLAKPVLQLNGKVLAESPELVKEAIAKVKNELQEHHLELPVQKVDGVEVSEYILQEQDGKTVMVYLDGDKVVVREINVELEKEKVAEQDAPQEEVKEEVPVAAPGRKTATWEEVEGLLIESGAVE